MLVFCVFDPSPLTVCISWSFFNIYSIYVHRFAVASRGENPDTKSQWNNLILSPIKHKWTITQACRWNAFEVLSPFIIWWEIQSLVDREGLMLRVVCISLVGAHRIRLSRYLHARSHNESCRLWLCVASRRLSPQRMEYIGLFYRFCRVSD